MFKTTSASIRVLFCLGCIAANRPVVAQATSATRGSGADPDLALLPQEAKVALLSIPASLKTLTLKVDVKKSPGYSESESKALAGAALAKYSDLQDVRSQIFTFSEGKLRIEEYVNALGRTSTSSFDGSFVYGSSIIAKPTGYPARTFSKEGIDDIAGRRNGANSTINDWYFETAGLSLPNNYSDLRTHVPIQSKLLKAIRSGARVNRATMSTTKNGDVLIVDLVIKDPKVAMAKQFDLLAFEDKLRKEGRTDKDVEEATQTIKRYRTMPELMQQKYVLDPAKNFAATSIEDYSGSILTERSTASEFTEIGSTGIFVPKVASREEFVTPRGESHSPVDAKPFVTTSFTVQSISTSLPENTSFVLDGSQPGTTVFDRTKPIGEQSYQVPVSNEELDAVIDRHPALGQATPSPSPGPSLTALVTISLGVAAIAITAFYVLFGKRMKRRA